MERKEYLMIPGPTPVPDPVLRMCSRPMINHRGPEFAQMQEEINEGLKRTFQTKGEVLTLTASGSGGMEAAIVNVLSPGDLVLSLSIGAFGERFAKIAQAYGAQVEKMEFEWGKAVDPQQVAERLKQDGKSEIKAVLVTHNETSTGITNDLAAIAQVVQAHGALILVDCVSSLVAIDCQTDAWGLDVTVAASQKAFMIPPGLAFVAMSDRAWEANKQAQMPRFYWDFQAAMDYLANGQTPFTPALPQYFGLREGLKILEAEGLQNCFQRHRRLGSAVRAGAQALGLSLFADPAHASNAVTAINGPEGVSADDLRKLLLNKYGVVLAGGQGKLKGKIFRIGHLGYVNETDILAVLGALGAGLKELGLSVDPGAGVAAAEQAFASPSASLPGLNRAEGRTSKE